MIVSASVATELPAVGTPMFLVLGDGVNFRSRLVSVDGDTFTVAAPLETAGPATPTPGRELDVFWVPPSTRIVLATRLIAISDESPYRWTLTATDAPRQNNRREYVRGGGGAAVRLATDDHAIEGALLDISEGGLRCWIDEPVALAPGDALRAAVRLGTSGEVELSGTILTVREAPHGDPGRHVVLTFDTPESMAQMIRLYVMAWEINERRLHREAA
ncbi:flagellar brake protein [Paractinoplanes globisporus]|uniref:Flagellar brake protein n=1 Tax=Paractinoplanes globisporus TaxID=113565 RepID=A0ABW6W6C3_9ACTN|nr:PilZ domain-containing protein [Actinoplanes globisporus]